MMGSMLISVAVVLLVAYWALGTILYILQPTFLYSPVREVSYTPGDLGLEFENVVFETRDRLKLSGWYIPADGSEFTVLFCHGNGGNMYHRLDSINIFYKMGLNCFIFDYRGYGNSEGKPSEEGTYLDAKAAYKWLTEQAKIAPDNIILFGRSLGGSIAAKLATQVEARGLIIESTFTSYVDIGRQFYPYMPVRWFAKFSYRTIDYVKDVHCPLMIIHSRNDEVVPFAFGLELYEAANEPKEFAEIFGSHNDGFLVSGEIYTKAWARWVKFLKQSESLMDRHRAS
jgi:fermentation-respiration switch protein FrsA (DUF1100 family)